MVGMVTGGFLGGYLFDISHGYVTSWLISFTAGLISALLAMHLLSQGEWAKVEIKRSLCTPCRCPAVKNVPGLFSSWLFCSIRAGGLGQKRRLIFLYWLIL
jgi:hypothetical protein